MSANRYLRHLYILPEDDANHQIANGFLLDIESRQVQILAEAGGRTHVCEIFASTHAPEMRRWSERYMILLIDFDGEDDRLEKVRKHIPEDLFDRVFVMGAKIEPEDLKRAMRTTFEAMGRALAAECRGGTQAFWSHDLLKHNGQEIDRFRASGCCSLI